MNEAALLIGGTMMLALLLAALHRQGYRSWKKARAKVIGFQDDPHPGADEGGLKAPIFRFVAEDGATHEVVDPVYTRSKLKVGSTVDIHYPPASPAHARLSGQRYTLHWIVSLIGLMILLLGLIA